MDLTGFFNMATKHKSTRYDVAEHLRSPEEMAAYLEASFEEADGDAAFIARALGDIARAKGMTQGARCRFVARKSLQSAFRRSGTEFRYGLEGRSRVGNQIAR